MATWSFMCLFLTWVVLDRPSILERQAGGHYSMFGQSFPPKGIGGSRQGVGSGVRNLFGSTTGAIMADKSPRQAASKKSTKSIKEKRADKRAAAAPASSLDKTSAKPVPAKKK